MRYRSIPGVLVMIGLLALAGCFQQVERPEAPAPTATATATVGATATPTPAPTPTPQLQPTPAATMEPTATPAPTATPTRTPVPSPRPSPTATATAVPELFLDVQGPENGATLEAGAAVVHGSTTPGAAVRINGQAVEVARDGRFEEAIGLSPGENTVEVVATVASGKRKRELLTVTYRAVTPVPFFLVITEPEDQSIVRDRSVQVSGRTSPSAVVSVEGVTIQVNDVGLFSTTVTVEPGPNTIDVVATGPDEEVLSRVIALIYRP